MTNVVLNIQTCNKEYLFTQCIWFEYEGKSGFVSHTKLTAEATFMDLFHSLLITCTM